MKLNNIYDIIKFKIQKINGVDEIKRVKKLKKSSSLKIDSDNNLRIDYLEVDIKSA